MILTSRFLAAIRVRASMLSKPFTLTSRKKPISARCAPNRRHHSRRSCSVPYRGPTWRAVHRRSSRGGPRRGGHDRPHRQRAGLEHDPFDCWCPLAHQLCNHSRVRDTFSAPDPLPVTPDRHGSLFHRNIEANIFLHGCSPSDVWARRPVESPYLHHIGEQPPSQPCRGSSDQGPAITPCLILGRDMT